MARRPDTHPHKKDLRHQHDQGADRRNDHSSAHDAVDARATHVPLVVRMGLAAIARLGIVPFGSTHMGWLRTGDASRLSEAVFERWYLVAAPFLWTLAAARFHRRSFSPDEREDGFQEASCGLWKKVLAGYFDSAAHTSEKARVAQDFDFLLRNCRRRRLRQRKREAVTDAGFLEEIEAHSTSQDEARGHARMALRLASIREEIPRWRCWPTLPMRRFILAASSSPDDVTREDLGAALAGCRTLTVRLRAVDESWALVEPWLRAQASGLEPTDAEFAFALRGPGGVMDAALWSAGDRKAACHWLQQTRKRAHKDLEKRLGRVRYEALLASSA